MEDLLKKMRQDCWDKALDSLAYSYIYSKKIKRLGVLLNITKVLGIIIPLLLGGLVGSIYYTDKGIMNLAINVTAPLALIQLLVSATLSVLGSDTKIIEYSTKTAEFALLNSEFEQLAKFPDNNYEAYSKKYEVLIERSKNIGRGNSELEDSELRMGMRFGLRNYRRACAGCNETPISMTATKCAVCGNF
jgi:mobilome CxxCx(11)CxxC protein